MKALSIRQPWAWLIIHAGKDVENRSWATQLRGRVLVHASQGMTHREYEDAVYLLPGILNCAPHEVHIPGFDALERGGVIGSVAIVDCVEDSSSPWFYGPFGFVLRDPQPLPFRRINGRIGFWDVQIPATGVMT